MKLWRVKTQVLQLLGSQRLPLLPFIGIKLIELSYEYKTESVLITSEPLREPVWNFASFIKILLECETAFSKHQSCSMKKGVLRNFTKFTGKQLCQSLFFDKVAGLRAATLLKKRLWHRCFPLNFAKFLRTPFLQNPSGRLHFAHTQPCSISNHFSKR